MNTEFWIGALPTAFWLGILTSISPCPLATNIAALSYISGRSSKTPAVVSSGLLYLLGRTIAYVGIAAIIIMGLTSVPELSRFLQKYMNQFIGPILVIAGMFLLNLIGFSGTGSKFGEQMRNRLASLGIWGTLPLGILFALSFCPVSAALYFGSLIPLALENQSALVLPVGYGVGTALPVLCLALFLAFSVQSVGRVFKVLSEIDRWARLVTGVILIAVGIYLCLLYSFRIQLF